MSNNNNNISIAKNLQSNKRKNVSAKKQNDKNTEKNKSIKVVAKKRPSNQIVAKQSKNKFRFLGVQKNNSQKD